VSLNIICDRKFDRSILLISSKVSRFILQFSNFRIRAPFNHHIWRWFSFNSIIASNTPQTALYSNTRAYHLSFPSFCSVCTRQWCQWILPNKKKHYFSTLNFSKIISYFFFFFSFNLYIYLLQNASSFRFNNKNIEEKILKQL